MQIINAFVNRGVQSIAVGLYRLTAWDKHRIGPAAVHGFGPFGYGPKGSPSVVERRQEIEP